MGCFSGFTIALEGDLSRLNVLIRLQPEPDGLKSMELYICFAFYLLWNILTPMLHTFSEFVSLLEANPKKEVLFLDISGEVIPRIYHLTEVKNCRIESVDCGGVANTWTEVLLQLWVPGDENPEKHPLNTDKILEIIYRVQKLQEIDVMGELFFEYNALKDPIAKFSAKVVNDAEEIEIQLLKKQSCCKAILRGGCC